MNVLTAAAAKSHRVNPLLEAVIGPSDEVRGTTRSQ
jgi:hypothetical protein